VLQTLAMTLILWSSWSRIAHDQHNVLTNGSEFKSSTLTKMPKSLDWAQGINLPAATIVTPVEFSLRNGRPWRSPKVMFFGVWIAGLLCWYMIGRLIDDLAQWRRSHILPPKRGSDLMYAFIALPSSILVASAFPLGSSDAVVTAAWGPVWIALSAVAFIFRVFQFIKLRRKAPGYRAS
jgi:hypothetical protein